MATVPFTITVVGEGNTGITTFIHYLKNMTGGRSDSDGTNFKPDVGVTLFDLTTNNGNVRFELHEIADRDICRQTHYEKTDAFIVMYDATSPETHVVSSFVMDIAQTCPKVPIIIVANKIDCDGISEADIQAIEDTDVIPMSAKTGRNCFKVIDSILTILVGKDTYIEG